MLLAVVVESVALPLEVSVILETEAAIEVISCAVAELLSVIAEDADAVFVVRTVLLRLTSCKFGTLFAVAALTDVLLLDVTETLETEAAVEGVTCAVALLFSVIADVAEVALVDTTALLLRLTGTEDVELAVVA